MCILLFVCVLVLVCVLSRVYPRILRSSSDEWLQATGMLYLCVYDMCVCFLVNSVCICGYVCMCVCVKYCIVGRDL